MKQCKTGLYIHIPFCSKRCSYCDFFSLETDDEAIIDKYSGKIVDTVLERLNEFGSFSTIYIGGGSPSLLSSQFFDEFQKFILSHEKFKNLEEFTVELNPADINEEWLRALADNGVNRISAGVQAFDDRILNEMGRRTTVDDIKINLPKISKYFGNISVDFIYGLGRARDLKTELGEIFKLAEIDHISAYQYTRPEIDSAPSLIDENEMLRQENDIREFLQGNGFERYEISNYSKKGKRSLHNMIYWSYGSWLGVGPGAYSFNCLKGEHSFYQPDVPEFLNNGGLSRFRPSLNELMEEFLLMGFRTVDGIDIDRFRKVFGRSFFDVFEKKVTEELMDDGLLVFDADRIYCTEKGFDLLNSTLIKLFESGGS